MSDQYLSILLATVLDDANSGSHTCTGQSHRIQASHMTTGQSQQAYEIC